MKKFYSLLVSGTISVGTISGSLSAGQHYLINIQDNNQGIHVNNNTASGSIVWQVFTALKKFTASHPLQLPYWSSKKLASELIDIIRKQLLLQDSTYILTKSLVDQITFGGQQVAGSNKISKITARYGKINTTIYVQPVINPQKVIGALEKITISHPLKIAYLGKDATAVVSKKSVTRVLRVALHWLGGVFNAQVVSQITFRNTMLAPGKTVAVIVAYDGLITNIYVKQAPHPKDTPVIDALEKITINHPLKIAYLWEDATASAMKQSVTRLLRAALQERDEVFTAQVVSQIVFRNTLLAPGKTVAVEVAYHSYLVGIYIREAQEDPVLHALHYFSDHPVKINVRYRRHYADEFSVLGLWNKAGDVIRNYLVHHDPTHSINFWNKHNITFSHTILHDNLNQVQAYYYHFNMVPIAVKLVG